jgi:hypothetical protein
MGAGARYSPWSASITAGAYAAIKATLPADTQDLAHQSGRPGRRDHWLDRATVDRLSALRGHGESYSDVI